LLDRIRNENVTTYQTFSTSAELQDLVANDLAQLLTDHFTHPPEPLTSPSVQFAPLPILRSPLINRTHELAQAHDLLLRDSHLLLVLDNVEQVISVAPQVAQMLEHAPRLKVLLASREPLQIRGEWTVPVPPLALPDPAHLPDLETLGQIPAVALFLQRAGDRRDLPAPGWTASRPGTGRRAHQCAAPQAAPAASQPSSALAHPRRARSAGTTADAAQHDWLEL